MAASFLRASWRTTAVVTTAAGLSYLASAHTTSPRDLHRIAHAETPSDNKSSARKMEWKGFTELTLAKSEQVSPNVKRLTFTLPNDTMSGLDPISSLISQHMPEGAWIPVFRPYTPISPPTQAGTIEFLVKQYPNGRASSKMHALNPGDTMKFRPLPAIEYPYKTNQHKDILMIAGGSGITPIWQLINVILQNPEDETKIALVYANNSEKDILLRDEIVDLEKRYPGRFRKVFTVSKAVTPGEDVQTGYVSQAIVRKIWPAKTDGQMVLVSGPPAMVDSVAGPKGLIGWTQGSVGGVLAELGYQNGEVHKF